MSVLYLLSKGAGVRKDGGRLALEKDGKLVGRAPIRSISSIVVGKLADISVGAIYACLDNKIPIFFVDNKWQLAGSLADDQSSLAVIRKQLAVAENMQTSLKFAKIVTDEKINNQYKLLKGYSRSNETPAMEKALKMLKAERKNVEKCENTNALRGIEGNCAKYYFSAIASLLDNRKWHFKGRTRPAADPVNALLNFGYAFLEREVRVAVIAWGLDPRIGFLHSNNERKDSLVFDLMEFFRQPVIDRFVLNLIRLQVYKTEDFTVTEEEGYRLNDDARSLWFERYEEYMEKPYQEYGGISSRKLIDKKTEQFRSLIMA